MRILFLLTVITCAISNASGQDISVNIFTTYLQANSTSSNDDASKQAFEASDYIANLFLFGENHGSAQPHETDVNIFAHLYAKASVRTYIAEVDAAKAWMLNRYLETADTSWLDKVFKSWIADTAQWASHENYNKFKELERFYRRCPTGQKFRFEGIDICQDYSLLKEHLAGLRISKSGIPVRYIDSLRSICDTISFSGRRNLARFAGRMLDALKPAAKSANPALVEFLSRHSFLKPGLTRDSLMFANFDYLAKAGRFAGKKLYGFLGFYHCLQTGYNNSTPFAAYLQQQPGGFFSGKTISMMMMAIDCKTMLPYTAQVKKMMPSFIIDKARKETPDFHSEKYIPYTLSNDNQMMMVKGIDALKSTSHPNSITIYNLNKANSPYANVKDLAEVSGFQQIKMTDPRGNTLQAFQFVILYRNSGPATPL